MSSGKTQREQIEEYLINGITGTSDIHERTGFSKRYIRKVRSKFEKEHVLKEAEEDEEKYSFITEDTAVEKLSEMGYKVERPGPERTEKKFEIDTSVMNGDREVEIAVISCTQIGSKYQQMTHLHTFYEYIQDRGIKVVLHAGDLVDGEKIYKGHEYELFLHGAKAQRDYTVENYPAMENGGQTYIIAGNHDYAFFSRSGVDIVEDICEKRDDIQYCGVYGARPQIGDLNIYLHHGSGGNAYARSYKMQKNIEQFAPEKKPDIYFLGHYHTNNMLPAYRNVFGVQLPCFQSQTPYLVRKGVYPEVGGWIIKFHLNDVGRKNNMARVNTEYIPFYKMVKNDY